MKSKWLVLLVAWQVLFHWRLPIGALCRCGQCLRLAQSDASRDGRSSRPSSITFMVRRRAAWSAGPAPMAAGYGSCAGFRLRMSLEPTADVAAGTASDRSLVSWPPAEAARIFGKDPQAVG
jgi:hypothetical protein